MITRLTSFFFLSVFLFCCGEQQKSDGTVRKIELSSPSGKGIAAFAEGCFWCSEHIFEAVVGVDSAVSGYAGGTIPNPTYELVNTETTGHAETVLVYYDPNVTDYKTLASVFFASHDPTTPDQQGPDKGSSYRSILFYMTEEEKKLAEETRDEISVSGMYKNPIVTEIKKLDTFYRAEEYHQNYIEHNPSSAYVQNVSLPRYELFKKNYPVQLKPGR